MNFAHHSIHLVFSNSQQKREVPLSDAAETVVHFLACFGERALVGEKFYQVIQEGDGETRFLRLLKAAGYEGDPKGFFSAIFLQLARGNSFSREPVSINGLELPQMLLVSLLEILVPGDGCVSVRNVTQLEDLMNIAVPGKDRAPLQEVIDAYPVRLSMHTVRQAMVSSNVARQYLPFVGELDPVGHIDTWVGQFNDGLLEQMYRNRVIFLLHMSCPVYCRFCFRKHKESRKKAGPSTDEVMKAVNYVAGEPSVKEILITGGDPFLHKANMMAAIDGLKEIPHVQTLRLATRSISYYPHLFYAENGFWLHYLKAKNRELRRKGKRMELATHFIHPDEISPASLDIISDLVRSGMPVYVQAPLLKGCNDKGRELAKLFNLLRGAGAEPHFLFVPCSPIHGSRFYWTSLSEGAAVACYLRAHLSDRGVPGICTATPIGKADWCTSGWPVARDEDDEQYLWIRTPYDPEYYRSFAPSAYSANSLRLNEEGTIDVRFLATVGDESMFLGSRRPHIPRVLKTEPQALETLEAKALSDQRITHSIVATDSPNLVRLHETRVGIDVEATGKDMEYIRKDDKITDVVIFSTNDGVEALQRIGRIVRTLQGIHHVNAVRVRSLKFNYAPEIYTGNVIDTLGTLNRLTAVNPLRLEIETEFLHPSEIRTAHIEPCRALQERGIAVYANTPLLGGVNDGPDAISGIAYKLREIGIEFHHVYVAGHPLQGFWNDVHPVDVGDIIDIGSRVRRDGSGREIPRYVILTPLGEADFGLTSRLFSRNGEFWVKLLSYDIEYYRGMDPAYSWPEGVLNDDQGIPLVPLHGLTKTSDFMVFPL
jgi:lysine 2,3-aminomutase